MAISLAADYAILTGLAGPSTVICVTLCRRGLLYVILEVLIGFDAR
jgi:hypothetical protein